MDIFWIGVFLFGGASGVLCGLVPLSCVTGSNQQTVALVGFVICLIVDLATGLVLAIPTAIVCSGLVLHRKAHRDSMPGRSAVDNSPPVALSDNTLPPLAIPLGGQPQEMSKPPGQSMPPQPPLPFQGLFLKRIGGAMMISSMLLLHYIFFIRQSADLGLFTYGFLYISAMLLMPLGVGCYNMGRKIQKQVRDGLGPPDPRPPVLYLRSFQDDSVTEQTFQDMIWKLLPNVFNNAATEEEQLTAVLASSFCGLA